MHKSTLTHIRMQTCFLVWSTKLKLNDQNATTARVCNDEVVANIL